MANKQVNLVLLVDDNETDNFISKRIIELTKFSPRIVVKNSGKSALEYLEQVKNQPDELPDVIFLDINMPIVDGFVFLSDFENLADSIKSKTGIVVLSSSNNKRDIGRIVESEHVIKFITKPLTEKSLSEIKQILAGDA